MVNKVILVGNLGRDPETRTTQSGTTIANLSIATTTRRKQGEEWVDHTEWHRVVCFGRTADNAHRFLSKGRQIYVEGRLQTRKWQDQAGVDRYTTEVVAHTVQFLGRKADADGSHGADRASETPDEDIPF